MKGIAIRLLAISLALHPRLALALEPSIAVPSARLLHGPGVEEKLRIPAGDELHRRAVLRGAFQPRPSVTLSKGETVAVVALVAVIVVGIALRGPLRDLGSPFSSR